MKNKVKYVHDAPLEVGDDVVCLIMKDTTSAVKTGTHGVVTKITTSPYDERIYWVDWSTGSRLALVEGVDKWAKVVTITGIEESTYFTIKKGELINEIKKNKK